MLEKFFRSYGVCMVIFLIGSFLIFYNLDGSLLWKDEAGTAQIGIHTMQYGIPKVWDGQNMIASADGNSFNDDFVVTSHGWLQFYIAGASISLLGNTTLAARAPFAFLAAVSILFMWLTAKEVSGKEGFANLTALIYICYIPFLLYARQARYYSLVFFFGLLSTWIFMRLFNRPRQKKGGCRWAWHGGLGLSVALFFLSNHLSAGIWCVCAVLYTCMCRNKKKLTLLLPIAAGGVVWLPWFIYTSLTSGSTSYNALRFNTHVLTKALIVFWKTNAYFIPVIALLVFMGIFVVIRYALGLKIQSGEERAAVSPCVFFILLAAVNMVSISIPLWSITNHYLLCVVIAVPFILAYFVSYVRPLSPLLAAAILIAVLCSNVLHVSPFYLVDQVPQTENEVNTYMADSGNPRTTNFGLLASPATDWNANIVPLNEYIGSLKILFYPLEYWNELSKPMEAPNEEIVRILKENAQEGENVLVMGIEFEPIVYYTDLRVVNNLSEKVKPWQTQFSDYPNLKKYSGLTYVPDEQIDWFIVKKDGTSLLLDDPDYLEKNKELFEVFACTSPDIPLSNSPDLDYHNFTTDDTEDSFYLLHRK